MSSYWILLLLMSGIIPAIFEVSSKHITTKKDIFRAYYSREMMPVKGKENIAVLKRTKVSTSAAEPLKHGSFKIDDGKVIGGGIYEIGYNGVSIDLNIKIAPDYPNSPASTKPSGGSGTTTAPGTSTTGVTTGPGATGTTAVPTGSSGTTAAPGASGTTAVPSGSSGTTAAPGASGTTAAPSGSSGTTAAPGASGTTAAPSSTTPSSSTGSDDEQEALSLHNKFRAVHDAPAMTLNAEMSQSAASYAQKIANLGALQHASEEERDNNGENLSYGCSSSKGQTVAEAVTGWYNEICNPGYSFGSESMGGAGHFTQLVWKESVELGYGKADIDDGKMKCTYHVARYKKAGNMGGDFSENVVKGTFDQSYCNTIKKSKLNRLT